MARQRYSVRFCDEGGTLRDSDGNLISHTWDVVNTWVSDHDGYPRIVANFDTRAAARKYARQLNLEHPAQCGACKASCPMCGDQRSAGPRMVIART